MTSLVWLLIFWGVVTTVFVILLIYRSTLTMHEEDGLYLGESEAHMQQEQTELMLKVDRINPLLRWVGGASGLLILVIAGLKIYESLNSPTP